MAYDQKGDFSHALADYINTIQLTGNLRIINGDVFYKLSRSYESLGRPCDAITPLETYISLDAASRRTPQITKIISEYAAKGNCENKYASGTARVSFADRSDIRLPVIINGAAGSFILDTGATFVSITSRFATKARIVTERENQAAIETAGGRVLAEIGYAETVSVGEAQAFGVVIAVHRDVEHPFGNRIDGLLGMSFLSRFNIHLSPNGVELTSIRLR